MSSFRFSRLVSYPAEPASRVPAGYPRLYHLISGRRLRRLHHNPSFGGVAQENGTLLLSGIGSHGGASVRSPGSVRAEQVLGIGINRDSRWLCRSHSSSLDHDPGGHILPQGHEQLACQGDDRDLPALPAAMACPFMEPVRESRVRLIAQPQPC